MDIRVEFLVGTMVRDLDGTNVGRIEEIRVERQEEALLVEGYLIGASGLIERLSARTLAFCAPDIFIQCTRFAGRIWT